MNKEEVNEAWAGAEKIDSWALLCKNRQTIICRWLRNFYWHRTICWGEIIINLYSAQWHSLDPDKMPGCQFLIPSSAKMECITSCLCWLKHMPLWLTWSGFTILKKGENTFVRNLLFKTTLMDFLLSRNYWWLQGAWSVSENPKESILIFRPSSIHPWRRSDHSKLLTERHLQLYGRQWWNFQIGERNI